ncbi:hypothetical protein P389DRAFT_196581 [Cystobasidium minutum MCA 4210]|uniref:uncharacterized protein n=1 Tax=Cystobasidium minutum MCA 4210 TaxID=1397322 RepID=UPI0034CEC00D|eukprot:jgi/Rhomi1/196581/gm1.4795_g
MDPMMGDPMGGPPPGMDGGFDDGMGGGGDMGMMPDGGGYPGDMGGGMGGGMGGAPSQPVNIFKILMIIRKVLSILAILTVIGLEASLAVQDAQLKTLAPMLKPANKFRKRDIIHTGLVLATQKEKQPKIDCEYYSGFDVPAVQAGQARSVLYHAANCIGLLGLLWLERPGTRGTAETLNCPTFAAPPVGNVGLVTFALLEIWLGTSVLNHFVGTFTYIAAFVLVVAGIMGLLFGVVFMARLKRASTAGGVMGGPPPPMYDDGF